MKTVTILINNFENAYLYYDEATKNGVVIDPGGDADKILRVINDAGVQVSAILLTHGHFDHINAADEVKNATGARIYAHFEDEEKLLDKEPIFVWDVKKSVVADVFVREGEVISAGGSSLSVIHTPGHTSGSICFYDEAEKVIFSGDTLFRRSVGRSDLPTGDGETLIKSIKEKLFVLPDSVMVYPGHEEKTDIGYEKKYNPYV